MGATNRDAKKVLKNTVFLRHFELELRERGKTIYEAVRIRIKRKGKTIYKADGYQSGGAAGSQDHFRLLR